MKSVKFTKTDLSILLQVKNIVKENNVRYIKISKHDCLYKDTNGKVVYFEVNIKGVYYFAGISNSNNDSVNDESTSGGNDIGNGTTSGGNDDINSGGNDNDSRNDNTTSGENDIGNDDVNGGGNDNDSGNE